MYCNDQEHRSWAVGGGSRGGGTILAVVDRLWKKGQFINMWPFRQREPSPDLVQRIETLERHMRDLETDWGLVYEKFGTLYARFRKRDRDANALESPQNDERQLSLGGVTPPRTRDMVRRGA